MADEQDFLQWKSIQEYFGFWRDIGFPYAPGSYNVGDEARYYPLLHVVFGRYWKDFNDGQTAPIAGFFFARNLLHVHEQEMERNDIFQRLTYEEIQNEAPFLERLRQEFGYAQNMIFSDVRTIEKAGHAYRLSLEHMVKYHLSK